MTRRRPQRGFTLMELLVVILIITALSYFPPLALGPIAEYFSMK